MNKKKIIVLSLVLLCLILLLVLLMALPDKGSENKVTSSGEIEISEEVLFVVPTDEIKSIDISFNESTFSIKRKNDEWFFPGKEGISISTTRVSRLLTEISSVRYREVIQTDKSSHSDYGFLENDNYVSIDMGGENLTVYRGADVASSDLCYIMTNMSDDVYMVAKERVSLMFAPFDAYRNDSVALLDFENITDIELKNKNVHFTIKKTSADMNSGVYYSWNILKPVQIQARDTEVDNYLINPVSTMKINSFASDMGDFSNYGIDKTNYISFIDASGKKEIIYFSDLINNKYYICVNSSNSIYEILPSQMGFTKLNLIDIADRQLYLTKQDFLDKVVIYGGNGEDYTIKFHDDGTVSINGKHIKDNSKSGTIFQSVCGLFADGLSTQKGVGKWDAKMEFTHKDSSKVTLTFSEKDERYYDVSKNGKNIYVIQKNKLNSLYNILEENKG